MLTLPNYSEDSLEVVVMKKVAKLPQKHYFITVQFIQKGRELPTGFEEELLRRIDKKSPESFKFIYHNNSWRLLFTLIRQDKPTPKAFSLVNTFIQLCKKS